MSLTKDTKKEFGTVKIIDSRGLDMTNNKIRNLGAPNVSTDAVNKSYVDNFRGIGDIKWSIKNIDHDGWLVCDGRSVTRAGYPELFALIGTSFGSGSGTTFNLPNCKGRVLGGIGQGSGLTNRTLGQTVGEETHTLTINEMPSHNHSITDPGHSHSYINNTNNQGTDNAFATETAADDADLSKSTGTSTTGITINNNGGGQAHNNMQPTLFIGNVFIFSGIMGV